MDRVKEPARSLIQQTLHGYYDGHRLLAASTRLPKDAERVLLLLSDLSGPAGGEHFEPYLTGYPVESAECYALARTWPAPQMPRPGCVWTHTLLIADELLGHLPRPECLLQLFHPPLAASDLGGFLEALPVPAWLDGANAELADGVEVSELQAAPLIRALYESAEPQTVFSVPHYSAAEPLFLSIWRLQWPNLRRRFTFCSGSRAPRNLDGVPFMLQAALEPRLHGVSIVDQRGRQLFFGEPEKHLRPRSGFGKLPKLARTVTEARCKCSLKQLERSCPA